MRRVHSPRSLTWIRLALLGVVAAAVGAPAIGQGPLSTKKPAVQPPAAETAAPQPAAAEAAAPQPKNPFRGRLPAYYGRVVDEKQRAAVYEIQKEYAPRIDALKTQLAALTKERDEKVVAVLTPEQRAQVEQTKAAAAAKRAGAKGK